MSLFAVYLPNIRVKIFLISSFVSYEKIRIFLKLLYWISENANLKEQLIFKLCFTIYRNIRICVDCQANLFIFLQYTVFHRGNHKYVNKGVYAEKYLHFYIFFTKELLNLCTNKQEAYVKTLKPFDEVY